MKRSKRKKRLITTKEWKQNYVKWQSKQLTFYWPRVNEVSKKH